MVCDVCVCVCVYVKRKKQQQILKFRTLICFLDEQTICWNLFIKKRKKLNKTKQQQKTTTKNNKRGMITQKEDR